jgi:uncharacterized membrane protein required for colicin V production
MNWVDALIIIVVLVNGLFGYFSGMVMQVAWLVTIVAGVTLGVLLGPVLGAAIPTKDEISGNAIGFLVIFLMIFGACHLLGSTIKVYVNRWKLEKHDRSLGVLLGVVKALVVLAIVCTGYVIARPLDASVRESFLGSLMVRAGGQLVTDEGARKIHSWLTRAERTIVEGIGQMDAGKGESPAETDTPGTSGAAPSDNGGEDNSSRLPKPPAWPDP